MVRVGSPRLVPPYQATRCPELPNTYGHRVAVAQITRTMYPRIKAAEILTEEGFVYTLQNEEIEIASHLRVPKGLRNQGPFAWADGLCRLEIPGKKRSVLHIARGYEWDGISAFEKFEQKGAVKALRILNRLTLLATIHHDALYEALRGRVIPPNADDWEAAYKWADRMQLEILENQGRLTERERYLWAYHLRKEQGKSAVPR